MKLLLTTIMTEQPETRLTFKYLYGVIEKAPIEISVREFPEDELTSEIYESIVRGGYSMVYFHLDQDNVTRLTAVCEMVKKAQPTSIIVVGGLQVSFDTGAFMEEHPYVDYVVRGEPEHVVFNFLKTILTYDFDFAGVPGLAYREDDDIVVNPYDAPVQLEDLPFPYEKTGVETGDTVYYESFRGAADRCKYSGYIPEFKIRSLSLNRVCTELRYFLVKNVDRVVFTDKWFNYNLQRAYRIWEYILNNDNGRTCFVFDIDGDNLDDEAIRLLGTAREGLFEFNIDVDSTNAVVLAEVGRKENIYQLMYNVTKLLNNRNIRINVNLRAGLPCEDMQLFARSFNKVYGLGATSFRIVPLTFPPGCALRDEAGKYGYQYSSIPPYTVISNSHMNALELIRIKQIACVADAYVGLGGFETSIPRLLTDTGLRPFDLFSGLTDYITENGLFDLIGRLEERYRILLAYATGLYDEIGDTLKTQILMDILHAELENCLSEDEIKKFEKKGWALKLG